MIVFLHFTKRQGYGICIIILFNFKANSGRVVDLLDWILGLMLHNMNLQQLFVAEWFICGKSDSLEKICLQMAFF